MGRKIHNITLVVEHTGKRIPIAEVDDDVTVGEFLEALAGHTNLPAGTREVLVRKSTRKQMPSAQTFKAIGIENEEVLVVDFARTAGGNISFYESGGIKEIEFTPEETSSVIEILRESRYAVSPLRDVGVFARVFLKIRGILQGFGGLDTNTVPIADDRQTSLRHQMAIHRRNLNQLQEQLAKYTKMDAPPYLLNRIRDEEIAIQHIEKQINEEFGGLNGRQ